MRTLNKIELNLNALKSTEKATHSMRFFKTGKGEYGEGDRFLGITVPEQRKVAKKYYKEITLAEVLELLKSEYHEYRLTALFILVYKFEKADETERTEIYNAYLRNTKYVNNWDLVDSSAHKIVGSYLLDKDRKILYKLANSKDLWEQRISIIATLWFIKNNQLDDTFSIAEKLLHHEHDLLHKAVGWMLREAGKKDINRLRKFLDNHAATMPRTMLRYSIEKMEKEERQKYLRI